MTVTVRRYQTADSAACRACIVELQEAERQIDSRLLPGEAMADEYLQHMHLRCKEAAGVIFVAEVDGTVAGLAMVLGSVPFESLDEPPGECAVIAELVVREPFRRQGIAAALIREAERYASEGKAVELRIGVLSRNSAARNLYLREGFAPYLETLTKPLPDRESGPAA